MPKPSGPDAVRGGGPWRRTRRLWATIREDLDTVLQRDPSVTTLREAALHPTLAAVWTYRMARWGYERGHRSSAKVLSNIGRFLTGVEIHPGARIGRKLFIDHGCGVVIGETAVIGDDVTIFHQVTLGAVGWWHDNHRPPGQPRHPRIGDRVVLGAASTVIGPVSVGDDAVIGAHALVVRDVEAGTRMLAAPASPHGNGTSSGRREEPSPRQDEQGPENPAPDSEEPHAERVDISREEKGTQTMNTTSFDHRKVVVIGGGPGGATAAALLARAGIDVMLLERETFPRYHIGESLAASCRVIMKMSGALDKVDQAGFPVKRGALLRWGGEEDWTIDWQSMFGDDVQSWHVDRDIFDDIVLRNAAEVGAQVHTEATVKKVIFEGDRPVAVEWYRNSNPKEVIRTSADHIIDASGRAGVIANKQKHNRQPHEVFRNVAIWGYYKGGRTLDNTPPGGINIISSEDGWYWIIPLKDNRHSVGFVTHQNNFAERRKSFSSTEEMLMTLVGESKTVTELIEGAVYVEPTRVEQDFSYVADEFCGPGHFVVGDAACFLDPLLSTGVHLAMYSAMLSAASIISIEDGTVTEEQALAFYESAYRHTYSRLLILVAGVYEQYKGKSNYFWLAQNMVDKRDDFYRPNDAFTELTSGMTDLRDASHSQKGVGADALLEQAESAQKWAEEQAEQTQRPGREGEEGIAVFRLEPGDLYDAGTGLYVVMEPKLGLRPTDAV
jgi:serine O-acetyltransferase